MSTNKNNKRIVCIALTLLLICSFVTVGLAADKGEVPQYETYTCLGDSIAAGLYSEQYTGAFKPCPTAYHSYLGEYVGAKTVNNYAFGAITTDELRYLVDEKFEDDYTMEYTANAQTNGLYIIPSEMDKYKDDFRQAIKDSDLITIGIGSNDTFTYAWTTRPQKDSAFMLIEKILSGVGVDSEAVAKLHKIGNLILVAKYLVSTISDRIEVFKENWDGIFEGIRNLNYNAQIVAISVINPFEGIKLSPESKFPIGKLFNIVVDIMNDYIEYGSHHSHKYVYCDICDMFTFCEGVYFSEAGDLNNFQSQIIPLAHPKAAGHKKIADKIVEDLILASSVTGPTKWSEPKD